MHSSIRRCQPLLGTFVEVSLEGPRSQAELIALSGEVFTEIRRIDGLLSFHREDSELSHINLHAARALQAISDDLRDVLREALWLSALSNGAFDISVAPTLIARGALPDHGPAAAPEADWRDIELDGNRVRFGRALVVDLGGIAKGYAVDRAMALIPADVSACVNAGGDLRMRHWRQEHFAIRVPGSPLRATVSLPMRNAAVASSIGCPGDHLGMIIDPRERRPVRDPRSYSVFAANAMRADALTKVACLMPSCAAIMRCAGAEAIAIDAEGNMQELCDPATMAEISRA
jgi:thiamine biosynthesis lipoprotein